MGKKHKKESGIEKEECCEEENREFRENSGLNSEAPSNMEAKSTSIDDIRLKEPVVGHLIEDKVSVREDFEKCQQFFDRSSFGEIHGVKEKRIELALDEALYLQERGKLKIFDEKGKELNFEKFVARAGKIEKNFWTKYQVYRDIRTRGYITKTALKFGADYRIYRRGMKPGEDHAKWVLFCVSEGDTETWNNFSAKNRVAHSTRKKLLLGIVDKEGEVTYYEIRWKKP